MRTHSYMRVLIIVIFISTAALSYADELQNNVPSVRYWKPADASGLAIRTTDPNAEIPDPPQRKDPKLTVIMYHNLVFGRTGNVYNRDIYNFEHDMQFLKRNFTIIDFNDLQKIIKKEIIPTTDVAIVTFDDGDLSMYALAYPLLKEYDIKATFFIVPTFIGEIGYMSWDQIREMQSYRNEQQSILFSFESHSLSHQFLGELDEHELYYELAESKRILEEELSIPVTVLALPYGSGAGDERLIKMATDLGYIAIRTSRPMAVDVDRLSPMNIPAFNVENYSSDEFVRKVMEMTKR